MRRARIVVFLGCVIIGVLAVGSGRGLDARGRTPNGRDGYLIRSASLVLTMDPSLGDGSILGQLQNADVLIVGERIAAVGALERHPAGVEVVDGRGMIVMPGFVDTHDHTCGSPSSAGAPDPDV